MTFVLGSRSEAEVEKELHDMRKTMRRIAATPVSARAFLRKHGFITKTGKLTKWYR